MLVPWLVIHKVTDPLSAFKSSVSEGGQFSAATEGFCGHPWHKEDPEVSGLGHQGLGQ